MPALSIRTGFDALDLTAVHTYLSQESTWAQGIALSTLEKACRNSLCFSGWLGGAQIAFARVVSDYATFANLVDVFVLPSHRGQGHSKALMQATLSHPDLQGLRRFTLATADAHGLYAQFGFTPPLRPASLMEKYAPNIYKEIRL